MKPIIFFAAALWASLAPLYAKAQCAVQPSCSSLGYTYTGSTSDCVNTPMKCPFNTSYFNCTKKADVFKYTSLNWNSKTTIKPKTYILKNMAILLQQPSMQAAVLFQSKSMALRSKTADIHKECNSTQYP